MTQIKNFSSKRDNVSLKYLVMVIEVTREKIPACILLDGVMERNLNVRMNSNQGRKKISYQRKN